MAARAYWKGYLKLSLVSCPIALYPATSEREKISFNQINRQTGHRIRYVKVDAESGEEVGQDEIVKGYQVARGEYIELTPEELEAVAIESRRTIDIDAFVPRDEIIAPDGEVGEQAFAVIRETIRRQGMVALARVVLTTREHVIALEPRGKGLLGVTLRYPYEVRAQSEYFDDIAEEKIPKDMLDLASHIVAGKASHFDPSKFEDHYEDALRELIRRKQSGKPIERASEREPARVINLMDALRRSVEVGKGAPRQRRARAAPQTRRAAPARAHRRRKAG